MYVSLWRENIPLAKLRKESQLTLQRHRVSRAAALLRGLPSEPLAWEMLLSRVFWLQRVRQSLLRSVLLRSGGQPILHLSSSEWRQYSLIHPPQNYRIPSMLCYDNIKRNSFSIFGPWDTHMPYPCSHFYFDIKFGNRLYSKEKRPGSQHRLEVLEKVE